MAIGWIIMVLWMGGLCLQLVGGKYARLGLLLMGMGIGGFAVFWLLLGGVHVYW
ncbi:hypothetical protein KSF_054820 [Reticulibacter mediterranei]|uniref:Uncharacterized protein n=1 Tax=Reticulibacter mediterranei TaxID=2778369 RepID=A0A8J3IPH7_9CHLR|nr:hypothetical protein [Reticulibacter mediterranei]GHO95434.1 hypothetical protein KSF_054820 [Reticulibacter mediterranei]